MSQWITLTKLVSEYGIDWNGGIYWTSVKGIIHSKINGLILIDNEAFPVTLMRTKAEPTLRFRAIPAHIINKKNRNN